MSPWVVPALIGAAATITAALIGQTAILIRAARDAHRARLHARRNRETVEKLYDELQRLKRERERP